MKENDPSEKRTRELVKAELKVSPAVTEILGKALTDEEFRERLNKEPEDALKEFKLTDDDKVSLSKISPEILEEQAKLLSGPNALTIKVVISKSF